jgi:hypothetical protein
MTVIRSRQPSTRGQHAPLNKRRVRHLAVCHERHLQCAVDWNSKRGSSSLDWARAKHATRDAWQRVSDGVERATPGDSDRDGK